jgi:hypothetical protein
MNNVAFHANTILVEANLVYWLSNSPVDLDRAAFHEKAVIEAFERIAAHLGYRVEKTDAGQQEAA